MTTSVYIDGFNLFYGCLKKSDCKWLDMSKLCGFLLKGHEINEIKYYTAIVQPRPNDKQQIQRQLMYIRALKTIPNLSIHYGQFLSHEVRMPRPNPGRGKQKFVQVVKTEEKGSDVNLATHLLYDGVRGRYDTAVVISNDSDLVEPIKIVREDLGLSVGLISPQNESRTAKGKVKRRTSKVLQKNTDFQRHIRKGVLRASQFPDTLTDENGTFTKPSDWD